MTPGLACKISWCHCDAWAQCQTHHVGHDQELALRERRDLALAGPEQREQGRPTGLLRTGKGAQLGRGGNRETGWV